MRRILALVATLCLIPLPSFGAYDLPQKQVLITATEVATGAPVAMTFGNRRHRTGYLVVKTENEVATASLVVQVQNAGLGAVTICTMTAITTETTTVAILGSEIAALHEGAAVTDACDWPMSGSFNVAFVTSGAGASFDVTAHIYWVTD
jgi:hypothetical protein